MTRLARQWDKPGTRISNGVTRTSKAMGEIQQDNRFSHDPIGS